jgi:hypothetical protein
MDLSQASGSKSLVELYRACVSASASYYVVSCVVMFLRRVLDVLYAKSLSPRQLLDQKKCSQGKVSPPRIFPINGHDVVVTPNPLQ